MTMSTALWSFALVVGLLVVTPGLDTAVILRTAAVGRRTRAWGVVLGIQTGTIVWGALTSLGVTALVTASHILYEILRWAGAAYLLWMAVRMIHATFRGHLTDTTPDEAVTGDDDTLAGGWRQGTLTNLLNPKMGVFYVAVLPQFIPAGAPHFSTGLLLTAVHIVVAVLWCSVLIVSVSALGTWLRRARVRRTLDRVTGTVIATFAVRLALDDRVTT